MTIISIVLLPRIVSATVLSSRDTSTAILSLMPYKVPKSYQTARISPVLDL
ncbi:9231_t:CDS:2, partial [Dentiscutata erythropus]